MWIVPVSVDLLKNELIWGVFFYHKMGDWWLKRVGMTRNSYSSYDIESEKEGKC